MSSEKKPDQLIGKILGQYTILQEIGRGGMATVYSATQRSMGRTVAIKVLPPHFLHDPGFLERFEREVDVISKLEHPHILPIYDHGEAEGVPFIAMRYLGGGSMAQMVRRGIPRIEDLVKPFNQVCEALDYAHLQGIIHRDLKPGNIMLDEYGNAYLSDFGIARVMGSELTGSAIVGTPAYMSPEQAHGIAIDARTDVYALGIVLFELITGREPYQAETPMSLLLKHINEPIPPITEFRDDVPYSVQLVVEKATQKNPDDRYSSAGEMAKAFSEALSKSATQVRHQDSERTLMDAPRVTTGSGTIIGGKTLLPATNAAITSPHQAKKTTAETLLVQDAPAKSNQGLLIGVGLMVFLLILIGGAAVFMLQNPSTPPTLLPTPFPSSEQVQATNYSISIPRDLLPSNAAVRYDDRSDASRLLHVWESSANDDLYITLALVSANRVSLEDYTRRYYENRASLSLIDTAQAPDGTIRRSYRLENDEAIANGQLDVFFMTTGEFLAVVEMYTADAVGTSETQIVELQAVLDSVRILSTAN